MSDLDEKRNELEAKQAELAKIFDEAGEDLDMSKVTSIEGDSKAKTAEIRRRNDELTAVAKELEELQGVKDAEANTKKMGDFLNAPAGGMVHPSAGGDKGAQPVKSLGEYVVESEEFKAALGKSKKVFAVEDGDIDFKTLFQTTAGFPPETTRTGRIVEAALRPIQVLDIIPSTPTNQAAVVYMRETVTTPAAAERAEAGAYAEAQLSYAEDSSAVRSIGVSLPITDEQLQDVPGVQGLVDGRLIFFLRQRLDGQVLVGNGSAPNLRGILNVSGIQTQAKGADPVPDAIYKAMTLVRVTGRASPSAIIMHPNDWQGVRLLRTTDGIYIWGSPSEAGPERIWGLPVVQTDAETENTALVGDFVNHSELRPRQGAEVQVGFVNDDFTKGKQTIRAGLRTAFVVYRAAAFCTVTGI